MNPLGACVDDHADGGVLPYAAAVQDENEQGACVDDHADGGVSRKLTSTKPRSTSTMAGRQASGQRRFFCGLVRVAPVSLVGAVHADGAP